MSDERSDSVYTARVKSGQEADVSYKCRCIFTMDQFKSDVEANLFVKVALASSESWIDKNLQRIQARKDKIKKCFRFLCMNHRRHKNPISI